MGRASATAALTSRPEVIENAVARILADTVSGMVAEPIPTIPIITSSREAPTTIPV